MKFFNSFNKDIWQNDRVRELFNQRKVLIYLNFLGLIGIIGLTAGIVKISQMKKFEPFVVKIDESTGSTSIISHVDKNFLSSQESLARYFIKKYLIAREGYNTVDYNSYSRKILQLYSSPNVYFQYLGYIRKPENNLEQRYGLQNSTSITIKSWSKLEKNKYIVRFSASETEGERRVFNKVAIIEIDYINMSLTDEDLEINPVGFLVKGYNVSEDES